MIDFPNVQNIAPVSRTGAGRNLPADKRYTEPFAPAQATATDVVQISTDAAMKSKLSTFAAALAKEIQATDPARIASLKQQYAGDNCPVAAASVAAAMIARARTEGPDDE